MARIRDLRIRSVFPELRLASPGLARSRSAMPDVSLVVLGLTWLGLARLGEARLKLARLGLSWLGFVRLG